MKITHLLTSHTRLTLIALLFLTTVTTAKNHQVLKLDTDTHTDLINVNAGQLYKQIGDGAGNLSAPEIIPLDFAPAIIDVADIDGDGMKDLIAVDTDGGLSVSLNNTLGAFGDEVTLDIGLGLLESVADLTVDFINDDELLDIAVVINGVVFSRVVILENDGMGGFDPYVDIDLVSLLGNGVELEIGDFNEDGYSDFLVSSLFGVLHSVLSDGLGGFNSPGSALSGLPVGSLYINDMNNDGVIDLLVLDNLLGVLTVRLGNGDGSFATGTSINVGLLPGDLITLDINHDGFQDIVVLNIGGSSVTVLLGDGLGGLVEAVGQILDDLLGVVGGLIGGLPVAMVSADFNGDCRVDIAIWSDLTDEYIVTLNQSGPSLEDLIFCSVFENLGE